MGIPGLTLRLINRGHWITLEQQPPGEGSEYEGQQKSRQQDQSNAAIIDGPGLAYYIGRQYREDSLANPSTELNPAYSEIGARAVHFLEDLEAVGLQIHAIFFDGVLPSIKLGTRKQRLQKIMKQLDEAKESFKTGKPLGKSTPEPPFLVPSVLESIQTSRFGSAVTVVPAEADTYCADEAVAYESRTGQMATIITNDSDLLVQASGSQTRIMLLSGLTRSHTPGHIKLEANVFFPSKLAATAGVEDLIPTAFLMSQDYHLSFDAAVAKAKKTNLDSNAEFLAFQCELQKPDYSMSKFSGSVIEALQQMDPRIAELAHQTMPGFPNSPNQSANMFLVPLFEDVSRFSAWVAGQDIRKAAYRMILSGSGSIRGIDEYVRRGTTCAPDSHPPSSGWQHDLASYGQILSGVKAFLEPYEATTAQRFNYIAMYYTISALAGRGSRMLSRSEVIRVLAKGRLRSMEELHAAAMCQAAMYSLRILKQLLVLVKAKGSMSHDLEPLSELLAEMPTLAELFEKTSADNTKFWSELAEGLLGTVDEGSE